MRKVSFVEGEHYHIYNRGVDKRRILEDKRDAERFLYSMKMFNAEEPIGSLYEVSRSKDYSSTIKKPLVSLVAYCLNPNHYHLILRPLSEKAIERYMHRLGLGYTKYFNERYTRTGSLFGGRYRASHIDSNEYLLHVSAYVNLNNRTHNYGNEDNELVRSSWKEYIGGIGELCSTDIVLGQFGSRREYEQYALDSLEDIVHRKSAEQALQEQLID